MGSLLIIIRTMGAGKTSVMDEASGVLTQRRIVDAAMDVDALGLAYLGAASPNEKAMHGSLRSVCRNYAGLGVTRFLLTRATESRGELETFRDIASVADTSVCRLTVGLETMKERVKMRESGVSQRDYPGRVAKLSAILDDARLEDFSVSNEGRLVTDVALAMLAQAGWIDGFGQ